MMMIMMLMAIMMHYGRPDTTVNEKTSKVLTISVPGESNVENSDGGNGDVNTVIIMLMMAMTMTTMIITMTIRIRRLEAKVIVSTWLENI